MFYGRRTHPDAAVKQDRETVPPPNKKTLDESNIQAKSVRVRNNVYDTIRLFAK